jgi:transcriptional regulator with XRE-family HTH domain
VSRPDATVTIIDVAREAGVSNSTVSRVVNNSTQVSPKTREKVLNAMMRLGYVVNQQARNLRGGRSQMIGLLIHELGNSYIAEIIRGIDEELATQGFFEAIEQLPEANIEVRNQKVAGKQLELEAKYTYLDQDEIRKCWVRVFYHETRQIIMTAQGATPEEYDYWLPMFFQAMTTVRVHKHKPSFDIYN